MTGNLEFYDAFAPEYADYYDRLAPSETVSIWSQALRELGCWPSKNSARLLDLGCGPGAHLPCWASHGLEVEGLDGSPAMLKMARRSVQREGVDEVALYCADVRDEASLAPLKGQYDLVVAHFNFLNLFSPDELTSVLASVASLVCPGGTFATDMTCWMPQFGTDTDIAEGFYRSRRWALVETRLVHGRRQLERRWTTGDIDWIESFYVHDIVDVARVCANLGFERVGERRFVGNFGGLSEMPGQALEQWLLVFSTRSM